ncbi:MAG: CpsD/CapB family tyrosine-protein kinase [Clostridia bacterium]|nr:CpsD/CapB family tyrosine-protein kinase [Clostridia bacterium]
MKKENSLEVKRTTKVGAELDFASREAYKLLRTNVSFAFPDEENGRVIGVCSACPHEGKSTTSVNLAYSLAEANNKVLLIDGDMRRPTINKVVEIEGEPGLSDMLSGKSGVEVANKVLHENLDILASGHIPPNPSELIGSRRMEALIEECKTKYDYVIIDLPPVLSVSDPVAVSKYLSGMIIVVRHDKTRRRDMAETIRQLEYANVKILGFVYNRVGHESGENKYRYKYKYRGYSYRSKK